MTTQCAIPYCNHPNGPCTGGCTAQVEKWRAGARQAAIGVANIPGFEQTPHVVEPSAIESTLTERGKRYGKFKDHASISQDFKAVLWQNNHQRMSPDQCEALEMICHKMARILNGDPDYVDSWVDIAGYAKLVADRLEGVER